jgi:hypothetical protein
MLPSSREEIADDEPLLWTLTKFPTQKYMNEIYWKQSSDTPALPGVGWRRVGCVGSVYFAFSGIHFPVPQSFIALCRIIHVQVFRQQSCTATGIAV